MSFPYGNNIKLYIDGESHGEMLTLTLEGFPGGLQIDEEQLTAFMKRRAPGQNAWSTARKEADKPVFLSGVENGITTGGTIKAVIYNTNQHSGDYSDAGIIPRPSHADFPAIVKYGKDVDLRGGGHFSGRLTALTCIAGALAIQYLRDKGIEIKAHIYSVGSAADTPFGIECKEKVNEDFPVINENAGEEMKKLISLAKEELDSVGGVIECAVTGLPAGLGEHLFAGAEVEEYLHLAGEQRASFYGVCKSRLVVSESGRAEDYFILDIIKVILSAHKSYTLGFELVCYIAQCLAVLHISRGNFRSRREKEIYQRYVGDADTAHGNRFIFY